MNWNEVTAIASAISTVAFIVTALYVRAELKALEKDRYLSITNGLFSMWQSQEFMEAQMWLLHKMEAETWEQFIERHRGDFGEAAFHRIGGFYDRVGTLVRMDLINEDEILSTIGGYAIAVWQKIEPLVREARRIENSVLFDDFEKLLPACYECYVPALGQGQAAQEVRPFSLPRRAESAVHIREHPTASRITVAELKRRLTRGAPLTLLDVRSEQQAAEHPKTLPGAIRMPLAALEARYTELPPDREVVAYCT